MLDKFFFAYYMQIMTMTIQKIYIPLLKLHERPLSLSLILIKKFHLGYMMTITKLMSLMKPGLIFNLLHLSQHPPRLNIDIDP